MSQLAPADALLFDLGRVVLDIDFGRALACWAAQAGCTASDLARRFVRDSSYWRHETGKLSDAGYFGVLRASLGITLSDDQLLKGWNAIFLGEVADIDRLLARAGRRLPLYAFSNTNPAHVEYISKAFAGVLGRFGEVFMSSTIGLRKPDAAAFDYVVRAIGRPASRIVFFDDILENVEGARAVGMKAVHVRSSADIAAALDDLGI